jgi:hypothetical protein
MSIPTKSLEMWLAGWSKSHRGGTKVTFWIDDEHLPYFEGATVRDGKHAGQIYQAVLVQLTQDGTPDHQSVPPVEPVVPKQHKGGSFPGGLCGLAVRWCNDEHFHRWMMDAGPAYAMPEYDGTSFSDYCRACICRICKVSSRKELDTDKNAAALFHRCIVDPYRAARKHDGLD